MPFVIHAAWLRSDERAAPPNLRTGTPANAAPPLPDAGRLFFWGENTDAPLQAAEQPVALSERAARAAKVPSHPAQMSIGQLRRLLTTHFPQLTAPEEAETETATPSGSATQHQVDPAELALTTATVWLPTQDGQPLHRRGRLQQSLTQDAPVPAAISPGPVELANWQVAGLTLPPLPALTLLSQVNQPRRGWNGRQASEVLYRFRFGNDLLFWSSTAKFALEILVGQHYLPSVYAVNPLEFRALWRPSLLDGRVQQRLEHFVQGLPTVCRAYNVDAPEAAPQPTTLIEHFVTAVVDAAVRRWVSEENRETNSESAGVQTAGQNGGGMRHDEVYGGVHVDSAGDGVTNGAVYGSANGAANGSSAWLRGLLSDQPRLALPPQPAHQFYREWNSWTEQLYTTSDANARICFALEDPAVEGADKERDGAPDSDPNSDPASETWRLCYYLQARDNETLLVSAREVWQSPGQSLRLGGRRLDRPQERLLAGLGAASRLFAPIRHSLSGLQPTEALLTTEEAHHFLREVGPLLESSGFGVIFPLWWQAGHRTRLGLRLRLFGDEAAGGPNPSQPNEEPRSATQPTSTRYAWELTLGGDPLTSDEFSHFAAVQTPLVRLRDRWIELDAAQVQAAQRFLASPARTETRSLSLLDAIRMAQAYAQRAETSGELSTDLSTGEAAALSPTLTAPSALSTVPSLELPANLLDNLADDLPLDVLPLDAVDVEGWLADALNRLQTDGALSEAGVAEPTGFVGELRPYQRRGVGWLAYLRRLGLGACLADDMGLGKSVQAIALLLHVRDEAMIGEQAKLAKPALLICPTSVVTNWRREVERFAPGLRAMVHHGNARLDGDAFHEAVAEHDLIITSFGTARRDIEMLLAHEWDDLILDEAQNIKNPAAKQTQAVRRLHARNRMALTGTPVENRLSELWSILEFLNPGYLGGYDRFRRGYVVPIERYNDEAHAAELRALVQPFLLRRLKSDPTIISDLPAKTEMVTYCTLTTEQAALYEKVVRETLAQVDESQGIQRRGIVLGLLTKLKQVCNHPAHYLKQKEPLAKRSGKLMRLSEMLEEALAVNDRALVFTQFVEMGHLLQQHLRDTLGVDVLFLHGGTTATGRDQMVQAFQSEDGPPIFVLSLRAGGSGINLTQANHVFHFDRWWNPAVENQATDRAFRIGQTRNVQVHKFVVAGTLEERIHDLIESKQALAEQIVGSGEEWLTELDTSQLRDLLTLRHEMVE